MLPVAREAGAGEVLVGPREDAPEISPQALYTELRALAASYLDDERPGHTLQPTALVHEAFVRLASQGGLVPAAVTGDGPPRTREDLFARAAEVMRWVLIDHARRRNAVKRGGVGRSPGERSPDGAIALPSDPGAGLASLHTQRQETPSIAALDVLAVDQAITSLERVHARAAKLVRLRFFIGLTVPETARVLEVSLATAESDWRLARAWLARELSPTTHAEGEEKAR